MALRFITIFDVLTSIQEKVVDDHSYKVPKLLSPTEEERLTSEFWDGHEPQIACARRYAEAARSLNEALHNGDDTIHPGWALYDRALRFATAAAGRGAEAERDGLLILRHATRAHHTHTQRIREHIAQVTDLQTELPWDARFVVAPYAMFARLNYVGFDRALVVPFLDAHAIAHNLSLETETATAERERWSEDRLRTLYLEHQNGVGLAELVKKYNVTRQRIGALLKRYEDKHQKRPISNPFNFVSKIRRR
jgi:hypothetical protein